MWYGSLRCKLCVVLFQMYLSIWYVTARVRMAAHHILCSVVFVLYIITGLVCLIDEVLNYKPRRIVLINNKEKVGSMATQQAIHF